MSSRGGCDPETVCVHSHHFEMIKETIFEVYSLDFSNKHRAPSSVLSVANSDLEDQRDFFSYQCYPIFLYVGSQQEETEESFSHWPCMVKRKEVGREDEKTYLQNLPFPQLPAAEALSQLPLLGVSFLLVLSDPISNASFEVFWATFCFRSCHPALSHPSQHLYYGTLCTAF